MAAEAAGWCWACIAAYFWLPTWRLHGLEKVARFGWKGLGKIPLELVGSLGWTRTNDQRINSPTLYRLSYQGTENQ
jgi:hypothetical protein